jgi:hypothetical protein
MSSDIVVVDDLDTLAQRRLGITEDADQAFLAFGGN